MKKLATLLTLILMACTLHAVNVHNMPIARIQPNGDTLHCYVTGDEFYHRLHDALNYTILRNPSTGYYVYAEMIYGRLRPGSHIAGQSDPVALHLVPGLCDTPQEIKARHKAWEIPQRYRLPEKGFSPRLIGSYASDAGKATSDKVATSTTNNHGILNNIVIFIRFSDDSSMTKTYNAVDSMFNDTSANAVSMRDYFHQASYQQIDISTTFYPTPNGNTLRSYQDSHPRSYYQPYDSTTNTNGYSTDSERISREFTLIENAVNYINTNYPVPLNLNLDCNNDNRVDNICFIVSGTYTGWNDLLWPHKWSLYDRYVYINGKRVYTFNLQLENSGSHYFSVSTLCHEMNHTLGAPDLYHYNNYYTNVSPAGAWDLMCSNTNPPQHMSAYMKYRYGNWLDTIPELVNSGTYTLHSLASGRGNFCYRIPSQHPSQYYVLEYRNVLNRYETMLPDKGLLIWRIDTRYDGNASFDDSATFDEVYLFRRGGTGALVNGAPSIASFRSGTNRTTFSATSNPPALLTLDIADTTITISEVSNGQDSTFSFTYTTSRPAEPATPQGHCLLTVKMHDQYGDTWNGAALRLESSNGHLYGSATIGLQKADSATEHIRICRGDSIFVRWTPGKYPRECSFSLVSDQGTTLYNCSNAEHLASLATVIPNGCPVEVRSYNVTATTNDSRFGTVISDGFNQQDDGISAIVAEGESVTLHARSQGAAGRFEGWCTGRRQQPYADSLQSLIVSHDSVLSFAVTCDTMFTALFSDQRLTVTVLTSDSLRGTVMLDCTAMHIPEINPCDIQTVVSGYTGRFVYGDTAILSATALEGYQFSHWQYGNSDLTDNPVQLPVTANCTITAVFDTIPRDTIAIVPILNSDIRAYSHHSAITVENAIDHHLSVYDVLGRPIVQDLAVTASPFSIPVPHRGLYLLRLGNRTLKIMVLE